MAEMDATMFLLAENAPQNESAKLQETKSFHMELQPR
jgi:hypothetical protein